MREDPVQDNTGWLESPIGALKVSWEGETLTELLFAEEAGQGGLAVPPFITEPLMAYFRGDFAAIDGIEVQLRGTEFQRAVWAELREIPAGTTISYGTLAKRVGRPGASRAVGLANGSNPISIVVPCHRVIGANGSLTGYGGGLDRKRWLLAHEKGFALLGGGELGESRLRGEGVAAQGSRAT